MYLHSREDRFLNSIVVAALGDRPHLPRSNSRIRLKIKCSKAMQVDQSFGVLTFAGGRSTTLSTDNTALPAIKAIMEPTDATRDKFARDFVTQEF